MLYITFDDISEDTCVLVDWGDGTVDRYTNYSSACDGVDSSRRRRSVSGPVSTAMTLSHTYISETTFTAIVRAVHPINNEEQTMAYVLRWGGICPQSTVTDRCCMIRSCTGVSLFDFFCISALRASEHAVRDCYSIRLLDSVRFGCRQVPRDVNRL